MSKSKLQKQREISGIVFLALAILLSVAYYLPTASTGWLGSVFLRLGKGFLGPVAYVLPALFVYGSFEFLLGRSINKSRHRLVHVIALLVISAAFFQLLTVDFYALRGLCLNDTGEPQATKAISVLWQASNDTGQFPALAGSKPGGLIGGLLGLGLTAVAGHTGALILLVAGALTEFIILFGISLTTLFESISRRLRNLNVGSLKPVSSARPQETEEERRMRLREKYLNRSCPHQTANSPAEPIEQAPASDSIETASHYVIPDIPEVQKFTTEDDSQLNVPSNFDFTDNVVEASFQEEPIVLTGSEEGFLQVGDETPFGATLPEPDELSLISELPLWEPGVKPHANETEKPEPLIRPEPIFSFDASESEHGTLQIGASPSAAVPSGGIHNLDPDLFEVPNFLQTDEREEFNPFGNSFSYGGQESVEEELEEQPAEIIEVQQPGLRSAIVYGEKPVGRSGQGSGEITAIRAIHRAGQGAEKTAAMAADSVEPVVQKETVDPKTESVQNRNIKRKAYVFPPTSLLAPDKNKHNAQNNQAVQNMAKKLEDTLSSFGVAAKVINITTGPSIMRFELSPGPGVKVSKIVGLADDIALSLAAVGLRIEAPIPGKSAIGIEIPNLETQLVPLRSLIESREFRQMSSPLGVALGRDIPGLPIICDLAKMPHLLIAGATGSGKSVCINSILISLLYRSTPEDLRLLLVDPKVVELSVYNGIPHLLAPVVTDPKKAANTLNWAVVEMDRRYNEFAKFKVRDLKSYNRQASEKQDPEMPRLPLILVVIDELADLMMTAPAEVEEAIARLTAKARAAGIHLIIATQRPSVDVITGLIKANIPSRIAFAVSSHIDSRTILDIGGAEKLLGKGDMLYFPQSSNKPLRGQGAFVTDREVEEVLSFIRRENDGEYDEDVTQQISSDKFSTNTSGSDEEEDELLPDAVEVFLEVGHASIALLQRKLKVGYPRASRLVDLLEEKGWIGPFDGSKPRKMLLTATEWEMMKANEQENEDEDLF